MFLLLTTLPIGRGIYLENSNAEINGCYSRYEAFIQGMFSTRTWAMPDIFERNNGLIMEEPLFYQQPLFESHYNFQNIAGMFSSVLHSSELLYVTQLYGQIQVPFSCSIKQRSVLDISSLMLKAAKIFLMT